MFNKSIEIDPEYALAHAGIADCYSLLYTYFDARDFNLRQAEIASERALELAPDLPEAHLARGFAASLGKKFDEAEREFKTAIELDPKLFDAVFWAARTRLSQGQYDEAVKLFERSAALRPDDYQTYKFAAQALASLGRVEEAEAANRRTVRLIAQHLDLDPDDSRALIIGAAANASLGESEIAAEYAERALRVDPDDPMLLYNVACTYGVLGRTNECLDALESAVSKGWGDRAWLEHDSDLDSIRGQPRYLALIRAM
jgi:tetratricopeptide (TPR) repeat protein